MGPLFWIRTCIFAIFFMMSYCFRAYTQSGDYAVFKPFHGKVIKIPKVFVNMGYAPHWENVEPFTEIVFDTLNIPATPDTIPLRHIRMDKRRGFLFTSEVHFPVTGKYKFTLASDDGSMLWIDGQVLIDNDAERHATERIAVNYYKKGSYPVKLWYYQGWPQEYRLELEAVLVEAESPRVLKLVFKDEDLKFDFDSFQLTDLGRQKIDSLTLDLRSAPIRRIVASGHTDNVGAEEYNEELSLKRARVVLDAIAGQLQADQVESVSKGFGEREPIADNDTEQGRSANRRVEVRIEYDY